MGSRTWMIAAAVLAGIGFGNVARAEDPTPTEMMAQIKALQAKVERLEANQATTQPTAPGVSTASAVQSDAAQRSQLLGGYGSSPIVTGWDSKGLSFKTADGSFSLHPGLVLDFRGMSTYRQSIPAGGGGETAKTGYDDQTGFDLSRVRVTFDGTIANNVGFFLQFADDQGTTFSLLDAYTTFKFTDTPLTLKFGQFKDPVWHERNLSEARLMAVDRSLVETLLGGGQGSRVQGVSLIYDKDRFRGQVAFHDGFNSQNTKFFDAGGNGAGIGGESGVTPENFGTSARGEFLLLGQRDANHHPFQQYDSGFSSYGADQDILMAGAGIDYSQAGTNGLIAHTVDLQYNLASGWSFYAAYLGSYRSLDVNQGVAPGDYYDPGFILQAAYLIDKTWEPFVRYDYTHLDPASAPGFNSHLAQEITVGANYYYFKQNVKFTLDASYLPNGSPTDSDALGILRDSGNGEFLVRAQVQLAI